MTSIQATEVRKKSEMGEWRLFFLNDYLNFVRSIHGVPPAPLPEHPGMEVTIQSLLGRTEPPEPYEFPVMTYTIPQSNIEKIRQKWDQYILGKRKNFKKKPGSPMTYTKDGRPEYPCKIVTINPHHLIKDSQPKGIYLTPLERPTGRRKIFYEPKDSILGAFTAFYNNIRTELQLIMYEKIISMTPKLKSDRIVV